MPETSLLAVDFFCGAGGMSEGLKQAGITVVAGVDLDAGVRKTYELNHAPVAAGRGGTGSRRVRRL
jgi:DNA (cytosine-5)-methyltransferase 1